VLCAARTPAPLEVALTRFHPLYEANPATGTRPYPDMPLTLAALPRQLMLDRFADLPGLLGIIPANRRSTD
jgi:hypothetical protein